MTKWDIICNNIILYIDMNLLLTAFDFSGVATANQRFPF